MKCGLKCEIFVTTILPYIRKYIAKILYEKYNLSQIEIARKLNVTQASISQYLYNKRRKNEYKFNSYQMKIIEEIAKEIYENNISIYELGYKICEICKSIEDIKNLENL